MKKTWPILCFLFAASLVHADPRVIAVTGKGSFEQPADQIRIHFSVFNQKEATVKEARDQVEQASSRIVRALMALGVSEADINSPDFTLDLQEQYNERGCPEKLVPTVGRTMEVLVRDVGKYRQVIDALVNNGATRIGSIQSELADQEELEKKAMLEAIEDAKSQARFLVEGLGAKLGKVHSIGDRRTDRVPYRMEMAAKGAGDSAGEPAPYEFRPQPVEVNAEIHVEFQIQ